ncbi:tyrosine-type recombinase/integrase [Agathobaculum butyriciproducens]|uniref:tyrosine-type recombinase/integrase n=1 Tax=Agathobaculum butyriciproducens TaxID=1628085 RepID=UPI0036D2C539
MKLNTWLSKEHIIRTKDSAVFQKRKLSEITARDVIDWQNEIRQHTKSSGESYSPDYLKNVHTQLSCIFSTTPSKYYGLQINPAAKAGNMGSEQTKEMLFWTKEEYLKFIDAMMDKPMLYYAFEILYWCGIREGELLALTPADFDLRRKRSASINPISAYRARTLSPRRKRRKSNRVIQMPDFLCDEMQDYFKQLYGLESDSRIFPLTKHTLKRGMEFGCKASGVKVIRIHDLRHSHVSLLINMGYSAVAIGNRVGHESVEITYRYAHLFPTVQKEMADKLNIERSN